MKTVKLPCGATIDAQPDSPDLWVFSATAGVAFARTGRNNPTGEYSKDVEILIKDSNLSVLVEFLSGLIESKPNSRRKKHVKV